MIGLSTAGAKAVPSLLTISGHKDWWIRSVGADISGNMGPVAQQTVLVTG
jgi:hypothetical protein|tara:strand:- start:141 stop:290 length:150 start_codon:yes stop_codon:yes gene_type:complete